MENLQVAAPVAPAASTKPTATEAPGESTALPWAAALQAALTQHAKTAQPVPAQGAAGKDPADPSDAAAAGADDQRPTVADAALAADPASMPTPLLAALPPTPPAAPLSAHDDSQRARVADALAAPPAAVNAEPGAAAEPRTTAGHDAARAQHGAPDVAAANADAMPRVIEHAAARDGHGGDTLAQPPAQFTPAHAAPAAAPPAATPAAQLQVHAAVGSAAWGAELGQKVVWMIGVNEHVAELRVNPPDLGPLDIKLTVNEHQTTAVFTSPHGAVRDAVESALPRLREVLAESGITLGNASVTADTPRDGAAFSTPHGHAQRGNVNLRAPDPVSAGAQMNAGIAARRHGLVDLFA